MKKTEKTVFVCTRCGYSSPKWMGKCPACNEWQTFVEEMHVERSSRTSAADIPPSRPMSIADIPPCEDERLRIGIPELDRVLGGGIIRGSLVLIGGDPGIGKSTLMLQAFHALAQQDHRVLYVSGEESIAQIRMRSGRLEVTHPSLWVVAETDIDRILHMTKTCAPKVLAIDSIQTVLDPAVPSLPGSVTQVRETALRLMQFAKQTGIAVFLVGHVTKDGAIAGPRLLEHMVDAVLYFEGERNHLFRILRAVKNRFGSTNEIGVFEMKENGLQEVVNPSAVFLAEKPDNAAGSVVTATLEGTRPILIELQALVCHTVYGTPRRTILGLDPGRVALLAAVMEKKLGMHLMGHDIFMNVAGGIEADEPAVDLAVMIAIASSFWDKPFDSRTIALGEVGLAGEIRGVGHLETRLSEAAKLGFTRALVPEALSGIHHPPASIILVPVRTIAQAMEESFNPTH
uniref:DNA repair protein RadA n=1 Tax=Desulfatirhabdium butyrativorans TaxID=340467 RepID=A0A7C4RUP4_9BACT